MADIWHDLPVDPLSLEQIEETADNVRRLAGFSVDDRIVTSALLDALRVKLDIRSATEMGVHKALSEVTPRENRIRVTQQFYDGLLRDELEDRDDLFHEIGHICLHRGPMLKPRIVGGNNRVTFVRPNESAENQAWICARALALPRRFSWWDKPNELISRIVGISEYLVAERRVEIAEKAPIDSFIGQIDSRIRPKHASMAQRLEAQKLKLWKELAIAPSLDSAKFRLVGNYLIEWSHYNIPSPPSQTGWYIREGRIVAFMAG